jgi:TonB family protein
MGLKLKRGFKRQTFSPPTQQFMPILETPPNPAPATPPPARPGQPVKVTTRRFGELEEHELIHLLDSIDDEIAKARFRESIYISVIICLALAWFAFYGPRVLFHEGRIVNPKEEVIELKKELPFLDLPKNLVQKVPPKPKAIAEQSHIAQTPHPDNKPPAPRPGAPGNPTPVPHPTPQPQPQPAQQAQRPQPPTPQPQPQPQPRVAQNTPIPDAPHPTPSMTPQPTRPNFGAQESPRQAMHNLANSMARGQGGNFSSNAPGGHGSNLGQGAEILSDTLGVDFGPYIKRLLRILYESWLPLIPEETRPPLNKEGQTLIRFTINKDGTVSAMHLDDSTHDQAIDRAAWGSITGVGQMPPLPRNFTGPNLELRIDFVISHDAVKNDF